MIGRTLARTQQPTTPLTRHAWMDNLRVVMIVGVIVALAVALSDVAVAVELKLAVVIVCGVAASFRLGWLATKAPILRRVV